MKCILISSNINQVTQLQNIAAIKFLIQCIRVTFPEKRANLAIIPAAPTIKTNQPPSIKEWSICINSEVDWT